VVHARRDAHGAKLRGRRDLGVFLELLAPRRAALYFGALVWLAAPLAAHAAETPAAALSAYHAPAGCPSSGEFAEQVAARTRLWSSSPGLSVQVEISAVPEGNLGRVVLSRAGRHTERTLVAPNCDELVQALALVVAILIDPLAQTGPLPARPEGAAVPPASTPPRTQPVRWHVHTGADFLLEGALAPELAPGVRLFVGLERASPAAPLSSLRLSGFHARSGEIPAPEDASAEFELSGVRLDACSFGLGYGAFRAVPCLFGEIGALAASGKHPAGRGSDTVPWGAVGAAARGSLSYAGVLFVELEAGALLPLVTYRFQFEGQEPIHETPVIAPEFALGLGARFP
jgi:hypothetical protein